MTIGAAAKYNVISLPTLYSVRKSEMLPISLRVVGKLDLLHCLFMGRKQGFQIGWGVSLGDAQAVMRVTQLAYIITCWCWSYTCIEADCTLIGSYLWFCLPPPDRQMGLLLALSQLSGVVQIRMLRRDNRCVH